MGWEYNAVFPLLIVPGTGPPLSGLYVYSPTVGFANLVASIAAAAGSDTPGNAIIRGIASYFPSGSPVFAAALQDGGLLFFQAAGPGGPWAQTGIISADSSSNIRITPSGAGNTILGSGLTTGVPVSMSGPESGGTPVLDITNTASGIAPILRVTANAVGGASLVFGGRITGDTNARQVIDTSSGGAARIRFGPGNAAPDVQIYRGAAAQWAADYIAFSTSAVVETWNAPTAANAWNLAAGPPNLQYKRVVVDQTIQIGGDISQAGALVSGQAICTALPAAYRPASAQSIMGTDLTTNGLVRLAITTGGVIQYQTGGAAGHVFDFPIQDVSLTL
jgi:hypothetical protein